MPRWLRLVTIVVSGVCVVVCIGPSGGSFVTPRRVSSLPERERELLDNRHQVFEPLDLGRAPRAEIEVGLVDSHDGLETCARSDVEARVAGRWRSGRRVEAPCRQGEGVRHVHAMLAALVAPARSPDDPSRGVAPGLKVRVSTRARYFDWGVTLEALGSLPLVCHALSTHVRLLGVSVFRGALPNPNPHASSDRALLERLLTRGTLVVAAAGNTPAPSTGANTVWEAAYPETLSVAGSSWRGPDDALALDVLPTASGGGTPDHPTVDLVAPGVMAVAPGAHTSDDVAMSGSSGAAAATTGFLARWLTAYRDLHGRLPADGRMTLAAALAMGDGFCGRQARCSDGLDRRWGAGRPRYHDPASMDVRLVELTANTPFVLELPRAYGVVAGAWTGSSTVEVLAGRSCDSLTYRARPQRHRARLITPLVRCVELTSDSDTRLGLALRE